MSEHDDETLRHDRDELTELVDAFLSRLDNGEQIDLDEFIKSASPHLQADLRIRCLDVLFLRKVWPGASEKDVPPRPEEPEPDMQLGDFRLLKRIDSGAMGIVYLARQISLERLVAIKVLAPHLADSERHVARFRLEAKAAAKLHHPGIVPLYAVGESGGVFYYAMEYVDGGSLHDELQRVRSLRSADLPPTSADRLGTRSGVSYPAQVAEIAAEIADALDYAHCEGVIHRDIKPQNILIGSDGRPRIVDFGLARVLSEISLSQSGVRKGTPYYMSPEQVLALRVEIDHRTDVFSLGVVLYEMLTLKHPFEGATQEQVWSRITLLEPEPIRRVNPGVPRDLETICFKAVEKRQDRRYASAGLFAADLRRFLAHEAILARPPSLLERGVRRLVRHKTAALSIAVGLCALVGGTFAQRQIHAREVRADRWSKLEHFALDQALATNDDPALRNALALAEDELRAAPSEEHRIRSLEIRDRVRDYVRAERAEGGRLLAEAGLGESAQRTDLPFSQRFWSGLRGIEHMQRAAAVLPDESDGLRKLASLDAVFPRLSVRCNSNGARVSLRPIDLESSVVGAKRAIGTTPLTAFAVEPGYYRVVVEDDAAHFAEAALMLEQPQRVYSIDVPLKAVAEVSQGMVRIESGVFVAGAGTHEFTGKRDESIAEPFWIDVCEVSNAEYREFVLATGHPTPLAWDKGYDNAWDRLPIVGVAHPDALLYAQWRGKRLPTELEWERAARGTDGRKFPWLARDVSDKNRPSDDEVRRIGRVLGQCHDQLRDYLDSVVPVDALPESRSPDGLFHMLGNVAEWTESISMNVVDGRRVAVPDHPRIRGLSYRFDPSEAELIWLTEANSDSRRYDLGFRCAKTAAP